MIDLSFQSLTFANPLINHAFNSSPSHREMIVSRCLTKIRTNCKLAISHTLDSQVSRIRKALQRVELELAITVSTSTGLIGWLKRRKRVVQLKQQLATLHQKLLNLVCSVYHYFIA